jgi:hypothetical protein
MKRCPWCYRLKQWAIKKCCPKPKPFPTEELFELRQDIGNLSEHVNRRLSMMWTKVDKIISQGETNDND